MRILMGESGAEGRGQALVGRPSLHAWGGLGACFFSPPSPVVGEGRRAGGREEFLRGNNGAKGGRSPQICRRGWNGAAGKVSSFWVWLSLRGLIESPTPLGGDVRVANCRILPNPKDTGEAHSVSTVWLPSSPGVGSGREGGRAIPAFLLPLSAPCTHCAHSNGV